MTETAIVPVVPKPPLPLSLLIFPPPLLGADAGAVDAELARDWDTEVEVVTDDVRLWELPVAERVDVDVTDAESEAEGLKLPHESS